MQVTIPASRYIDSDNAFSAAAADYARSHGLTGWNLSAAWADNQRDSIILDVPDATFTQSDYCRRWGSAKNARRVHGLSKEDKAAIRAGQSVMLAGCPAVRGVTVRRIIERNGRFYARMP